MKKTPIRLSASVIGVFLFFGFQTPLISSAFELSSSFVGTAHPDSDRSIKIDPTPSESSSTHPYFSIRTIADSGINEIIINGPPVPPPGYDRERFPVTLPEPNPKLGINTLPVPAFRWFFGCSATSGAMIAGYYDRNGFPNMYTGPTNGGVIPLDNSYWPTWTDGAGYTFHQCPLTASRKGLDGRATRGSIDDYWVEYLSLTDDPYITNGWTQHTWGDAIGDYMKTSQSSYYIPDGATAIHGWYSNKPLTCSEMETWDYVKDKDGNYGRKLFYEARGYNVTDCYNQCTDNQYSGGFSFSQYKAEIDAGHPVMIHVTGHSMVGVGYDDSTKIIYLHDTWDNDIHTMTWGGSYVGMTLYAVSILNIQGFSPTPPSPTTGKTMPWMMLLLGE